MYNTAIVRLRKQSSIKSIIKTIKKTIERSKLSSHNEHNFNNSNSLLTTHSRENRASYRALFIINITVIIAFHKLKLKTTLPYYKLTATPIQIYQNDKKLARNKSKRINRKRLSGLSAGQIYYPRHRRCKKSITSSINRSNAPITSYKINVHKRNPLK